MASPRIIIPHGLAADVLRVLGDGAPRDTRDITDRIGLHGYTGWRDVWFSCVDLMRAGYLSADHCPLSTHWSLRRG